MESILTPRERFGLLLIDEAIDRVVTYPILTAHASQIYNCTVAEYCTDGVILGKAQSAAFKYYNHDAISIFTGVGLIAEAFGSKLELRKDDIPILIEPCLNSGMSADDLSIPDPLKDGRMHVYLDAIEYCYQAHGDIVPVIVFIPAPFTTAAHLRGIDKFLMDTIREPENAHKLLSISTIAAERLIDECMIRGAMPMLADPLASCSVISPSVFEQFALPYLKKLIKFMHRYDLDTMIHICGETELLLDGIQDTETDLFSFDRNDCIKTKNEIGNTIRLIGNIDPAEILLSDPKTIYNKVKKTVTDMKDTQKGFLISTGCEIPVKSPVENVKAFISAAHDFGKYRNLDL